jgi:hypothetical protein
MATDAGSYTDVGWQLSCPPVDTALIDALAAAHLGHGERNLLTCPLVQAWIARPEVAALVSTCLGPDAEPLAATWFDKQDAANWRVPWHQDLHAALVPFTAEGWGPWSDKHGVPHVRLPPAWATGRVALRLFVDACDADNGPLHVLPGTHRAGVLAPEAIEAASAGAPVVMTGPRGAVLAMHPLVLHRSPPARRPAHRRVLHVEWCALPPPVGARWKDLIP